jgi:hypothetical protein
LENIKDIDTNEIEAITPEEQFVLKVRGGDSNSPDESKRPTDPVGLSRSILHVLDDNPYCYCKINSVGPKALNAALAGFRLAAIAYSGRTKGTVLVLTQSEYTAIVAGNKTRGICSRIFPIPVTDQM